MPADSQSDDWVTVTLITGDKVWVSYLEDGQPHVAIEGRERPDGPVSYEIISHGEDIYVYPEDVTPLIGSFLDRELFNATGLVEQGYHDEATDSIPVLMTASGTGSAAGLASDQVFKSAGFDVTYAFSYMPAVAGAFKKDDVAVWGDELAAAAAELNVGHTSSHNSNGLTAAYGIEKVWLDQKVEAFLQDSIDHIGARAAWDMGYDGEGLRIAILDSGIDTGHPDLADQVVLERNFTDEADAGDYQGHGTHVAGIVAGTGAASDGLRKGVAPGAKLFNGKVLESSGRGQASWVAAAMEWAAEEGAHVVNMSLGIAQASDGTDPISMLLNQLTEQFGTLFVVAAGNAGAFQSVAIPAVADSALAVGNFSKSDRIARLSSRGPRYGDWAIKPEIAAPGELITAARAEGASLGPIVEQYYMRISGTSMASPHVAGAAAVLLQKYPDMTPSELKAALAGTAEKLSGYTVYEQGAGRLNVERAVSQEVFTTEATLDFGMFLFPFEYDPVTKSFGFRNVGDEDVTLSLEVEVRNEKGDVVTGLLELEEETIVVPAGGTVESSVTLNPAGADASLYSAYITAVSENDDTVLDLPVGFYFEPERFDLTVELITPSGQSYSGTQGFHVLQVVGDKEGRDTLVAKELDFIDGAATLRLDPGVYHIAGIAKDSAGWTMATSPEIPLYEDNAVTIDLRDRVPVDAVVETHDVERDSWQNLRVNRQPVGEEDGKWGLSTNAQVTADKPLFVIPTEPVTEGRLLILAEWRLSNAHLFEGGTLGDEQMTLFQLAVDNIGYIPVDMVYTVTEEVLVDLVSVENHFHANEDEVTINEFRSYSHPDFAIGSTPVHQITVPVVRQDYLTSVGGWVDVTHYNAGAMGHTGRISGPGREYNPGDQIIQTWFKQPIRPTLVEANFVGADGRTRVDEEKPGLLPARMADYYGMGDFFVAYIPDFIDSGFYRISFADDFPNTQTAMRLYKEGEVIQEQSQTFMEIQLDPEPAEYTLEIEVDLSRGGTAHWAQMSTHTRTAWTFESAAPEDEQEYYPFLLVDYDVDLSIYNTAPRPGSGSSADEIDLWVHYPIWHDEEAAIEEVSFWVSGDDGDTWIAADVTDAGNGHYTADISEVGLNDKAEYVSMKIEAWTDKGEGLEQEIIRAYRLVDVEGPQLTVTEPEEGTHTNDDTITVAGTVIDADGGDVTVAVNGKETEVAADGSFETRILLPEDDGDFTITVVATGEDGGSTTETRTVVVDRTPPVIDEGSLDPAVDVELQWGDELGISFTGEAGLKASYQLLVAGAGAGDDGLPGVTMEEVDKGVYKGAYKAPEGAAFTGAEVEIYAMDLAGNITTVTAPGKVTVIPDEDPAGPPTVTIDEPADGFLTNRDAVRVSGVATDDQEGQQIEEVTVNGRAVEVAADGTFTTRIILWEGDNAITVTATNTAGETATETVTVEADWTAPSLTDVQPASDITVEWGETVTFRFKSEEGLTAAYQVVAEGSHGTWITRDIPVKGTPMSAVGSDLRGTIYEGTFTAPEGVLLENAIVQFNVSDAAGNVIMTTAPGELTVVKGD